MSAEQRSAFLAALDEVRGRHRDGSGLRDIHRAFTDAARDGRVPLPWQVILQCPRGHLVQPCELVLMPSNNVLLVSVADSPFFIPDQLPLRALPGDTRIRITCPRRDCGKKQEANVYSGVHGYYKLTAAAMRCAAAGRHDLTLES